VFNRITQLELWARRVTGVLMLLRFAWIDTLNRLSYTSFDLGLTALAAMTSVVVATRLWRSGVQAGA
jgi:hypothetical protein